MAKSSRRRSTRRSSIKMASALGARSRSRNTGSREWRSASYFLISRAMPINCVSFDRCKANLPNTPKLACSCIRDLQHKADRRWGLGSAMAWGPRTNSYRATSWSMVGCYRSVARRTFRVPSCPQSIKVRSSTASAGERLCETSNPRDRSRSSKRF